MLWSYIPVRGIVLALLVLCLPFPRNAFVVNLGVETALADVPDIRGTYAGTISETWTGCEDPNDDGPFSASGKATISTQVASDFSGTTSLASGDWTEKSTFTGTVTEAM